MINDNNISGEITTNIDLDTNIDNIDLDSSISVDSISGDISSLDIDGEINNQLEIDAVVNPITPTTNDYNRLNNKPKINYVELKDNKTLDDLNIQIKGDYPDEALTNMEIEELIDNFV